MPPGRFLLFTGLRSLDARTVRCAHCQVYLPRDEAVESDGRSYCSREHAEQSRA